MRRTTVFTMFLALVFVLAACGGGENEETDATETGVTDEVWAEIQEEGVITVGTSGTLFPTSYYPEGSDELTGFEVEVQREIANRLGVDVQFEVMAYDAILAAIDSGRVDMTSMGIRGEGKEKFSYTQPIKHSYTTMIVRKDDNSGIESLEDLEGKVAGGIATTVYSEIAEKYGAELKIYGNVPNDVYSKDVHNGRTDVIINDYYLQKLGLELFPDLNIHMHPDLKFHPTTTHIVMPKQADKLHQEVDRIVGEMLEDGTLKEISEQFFDGQDISVEPEEDIIEIEGITN